MNNNKKKIADTLSTIISYTLLYVGVLLIFFGTGLGDIYLMQENTTKANANLTAKKIAQNKKRPTSYNAKKTSSIDTKALLKAKQEPAYAIGRLAIPSVNIHVPVLAGYGENNQNLAYGVVTCLPQRKMGAKNNYVVAGHYMGSAGAAVLDNLHLAKPGAEVSVTDLRYIYTYQLKTISFSIKPTQVEVENNKHQQRLITLITCSDFNTAKYGVGANRTVAQGVLVKRLKATPQNLVAKELTQSVKTTKTIPKKSPKKKLKKQIVQVKQIPLEQQMWFMRDVMVAIAAILALLTVARIWRIWTKK